MSELSFFRVLAVINRFRQENNEHSDNVIQDLVIDDYDMFLRHFHKIGNEVEIGNKTLE